MDVSLQVVTEPNPQRTTVLDWGKTKEEFNAFIAGQGSDSFLCGGCGAVLCTGVNRDLISNIFFKCPFCGNFNLKR